jgi:hypothetical protein
VNLAAVIASFIACSWNSGAPVPSTRLEWDRERACFADLSVPLPADAGGGLLEGIG